MNKSNRLDLSLMHNLELIVATEQAEPRARQSFISHRPCGLNRIGVIEGEYDQNIFTDDKPSKNVHLIGGQDKGVLEK